jgi:UvrD-like helicase C-terminal domain
MRRERGANEITRRLPPYMCRKPRPFDLVKESRNVGHDGRAALLGAHRLEDRIYLILGPAVLDRCVLSLDEEIEEERRLLYVGMTRAKDHLHLILPQSFFAHQQRSNGDRHMYTARTRFIPDSIVDRFEVCVWPEATTVAMAKSRNVEPVDIGARMGRMWR